MYFLLYLLVGVVLSVFLIPKMVNRDDPLMMDHYKCTLPDEIFFRLLGMLIGWPLVLLYFLVKSRIGGEHD